MVKPINLASIEAKTGKSWETWMAELNRLGAAKLSHKEIAKKLMARGDVSGWWAQGITVAYEQQVGRRAAGQMHDGSFSISASRTIGGGAEAARALWLTVVENKKTLVGRKLVSSTMSSTTKRLYWKCTFTDGSRAIVSFEPKGNDKSLISIAHEKITEDRDHETVKEGWRTLLLAI